MAEETLPRYWSTPADNLSYEDLLFSTMCREDQERTKKSWLSAHPKCAFCGKAYRWSPFAVECHMDPTLGKDTCGKARVVTGCKMASILTSSDLKPRFNKVQAAIREKAREQKQQQKVAVVVGQKRRLAEAGGNDNNPIDCDARADGGASSARHHAAPVFKRTTNEEMEQAWSEAFIANGLPMKIFDDPHFRKAVMKTASCGEQSITLGKGGKRDTTMPHRTTYSKRILPATDARLDAENMARMRPKYKKVGATLMSDGWVSTSGRPIINIILGVDGLLTLRVAVDTSGKDKTMQYIFELLEKVIEDIGPENIFSVVMDGACKGAFPLIRGKYPHIQCFVCPSHGLDGFLKNACSDKEDIRMQANEMGGAPACEVEWDEIFFKEAFGEAWVVIKTAISYQKSLALFRQIALSLREGQQPKGGTEPKKFGKTRYGSRVSMARRMLATRAIYEKLMVDDEFKAWLAKQKVETKDKVCSPPPLFSLFQCSNLSCGCS